MGTTGTLVRPLRPRHRFKGADLDLQDVPVQDQQRAERLVLRGGADVA
jgi:hypothetical protein